MIKESARSCSSINTNTGVVHVRPEILRILWPHISEDPLRTLTCAVLTIIISRTIVLYSDQDINPDHLPTTPPNPTHICHHVMAIYLPTQSQKEGRGRRSKQTRIQTRRTTRAPATTLSRRLERASRAPRRRWTRLGPRARRKRRSGRRR